MKGPAKGMRLVPTTTDKAASCDTARKWVSEDSEREISMVQVTPTVQRYD